LTLAATGVRDSIDVATQRAAAQERAAGTERLSRGICSVLLAIPVWLRRLSVRVEASDLDCSG